MAHRDFHPTYTEGCFGCKVLSVNVGAGALEVRGADVRSIDAKDKTLAKDLDAYKRLRHDGLQPKTIDGSHNVESRVNSQFDIDLGHVVPKAEESRVREGMDWAKEHGLVA